MLDLEDSLWDVDDEARTAELKAAGRAALTDLARSHANLFAGQPIGVRINRISGPEAALDIDALAQASRTVTFDCIVTTKVETAAEITTTLARLPRSERCASDPQSPHSRARFSGVRRGGQSTSLATLALLSRAI